MLILISRERLYDTFPTSLQTNYGKYSDGVKYKSNNFILTLLNNVLQIFS